MPAIKHYEVSQTRKVKVAANNPTDAARIATKFLDGATDPTIEGVWGHPTSDIRVADLTVYEEI